MNKKGVETETGFTVSLIIMILVLVILVGCTIRIFSSKSCPAGYDTIVDVSQPEIFTFCGSLEAMEEINYRCCQRKSNPSELCRYDLDKEEFVLCRDLRSFDALYDKTGFTCEEEVPCGSAGANKEGQACSGVACSEGNICVVEKAGGKWSGKCVDRIIIEEREMYFVKDENTLCGLKQGPEILGVNCNKEEEQRKFDLGLGNHCVLQIHPSRGNRFLCTGAI